MSGQLPPHKGDNNNNDHDDHFSPPGRVAGRSNNPTPQSTEEERRNLIRSVMQQASASLDAVAAQPGMPQRADYPSHEAWLRALLTSSLQQSEDISRFFADAADHHNNHNNNNADNDDDQGNGNGTEPTQRDESKDASS